MGWVKPDREKERYYLLPGQGGSGCRRKRKRMLQWAVAIGFLVSAGLAAAMLWLNAGPR